jgi:hypothetical protein
MIFTTDYTILNEDEIHKNNGEIIENCFYQYFIKKNSRYIYDFLKFIKKNAYPSWEDIAESEDKDPEIKLFLLSRYTMALMSFLINIMNDVELKKTINDSDVLDEKIKSYIIKRYYLYIINDSANILKNNGQTNNSKIIIWGFKDRIKKFKSLFEFVSLNKDVIYIMGYCGIKKINSEIIVNGKIYSGIKKSWIKRNSYSIRQGTINIDITFNKWKNAAEVSWSNIWGPLCGDGGIMEFTKKNNKWWKSRVLTHWIT